MRGYKISVGALADRPIMRDSRSEKPGLLERGGHHTLRQVSVMWCREHPVEASELPSWDVSILARVLEGVR